MMTRHLRRIGFLLTVLVTSTAMAEEDHVKAKLVADVVQMRPGETFHLGVLLEPEPGWHVYWRNPGEAGLATEVVFDLPEGFEVGELQWPVPVVFEQPGGIAGFGYERPVVLAAEVTASGKAVSTAAVGVRASWLACKDVCVLGSAEMKAELPLEGDERAASKAALEGWSETLPIAAEPGLFELSVTGGPVPETGSADLAVWLNWKEPPGSTVEFFPDPGAGLKVDGVRTRTRGRLTRIDFRTSRLQSSSAPAETLRSLIAIEDPDGNRRALVSHIDIE